MNGDSKNILSRVSHIQGSAINKVVLFYAASYISFLISPIYIRFPISKNSPFWVIAFLVMFTIHLKVYIFHNSRARESYLPRNKYTLKNVIYCKYT